MGRIKLVGIIIISILIMSIAFSGQTRVVSREQYSQLKNFKTTNIDVSGAVIRNHILDKVNVLDGTENFVEDGKIGDALLFDIEKNEGVFYYNRIAAINRFWLALLSLNTKDLIVQVNDLINRVEVLETQNNAYNYCLQTQTTYAGYRQCVGGQLN